MSISSDLKKLTDLENIPEAKLEKLAKLANMLAFEKEDVIFRENEKANTLYIVKQGKVLLERSIKPNVTLALGAINPGMVFGWTTLHASGYYAWDAISDDDSVIFAFNIEKLRKLCDEDNELGYLLLGNLLVSVKTRLDFRTEQLVRVIKTHPDIQFTK